MKVSYFDQVNWFSSKKNIFEQYCAVIPKVFGRKIKYFEEVDKNRVEMSPIPSWNVLIKMAVIVSHFTLFLPVFFYAGKAINRKIHHLELRPEDPSYVDPKYVEVAKEIRKLRNDPAYVPEVCKRFPMPIRMDVPADSIIDEMDPNFPKLDLFSNFKLLMQKLPPDIQELQNTLLEKGFNSFYCVHGIENAKGGIRNLLNIMIEGVLRAPYSGGLNDGPSDIAAGPHGPYYVVLNPAYDSVVSKRCFLWKERAQVAFLVPQAEDRQFLEKGLSLAVERGYITEREKKRALAKVITYQEFVELPKAIRHSEAALEKWLQNKA